MPDGERTNLAVARLVLEIEALTEELGVLARLARTDPLTGLANRRGWDEQLARELARARRSGDALSVALLDLNDVKAFNDAHGHQADEVIARLQGATPRDRSCAAGVVGWDGREIAEDLLGRADKALFHAKGVHRPSLGLASTAAVTRDAVIPATSVMVETTTP
jgi:predicted signal transduction protein with EAL and GGDEF domain